MSHPICPASINAIKRYAKELKSIHGFKYAQALDAAAQAGNFENFKHAINFFASNTPSSKNPTLSQLYPVYITSNWKDRPSQQSGRETLTIYLSAHRLDLMAPADINMHRAFHNFRNAGPDHIERTYLIDSQARAREAVCTAARLLQFMDATRLRLSRAYQSAYPQKDDRYAIPAHDHASVWYDRRSKGYVYVDEPYETSAMQHALERKAWAEKHNQLIAKPEWAGMHNPGFTRLYLITSATGGVVLKPMIEALNALPKPIDIEDWDGESAPMFPPFISPGAIDKEQAWRVKPKPIPATGPRNSVAYKTTLRGSEMRPSRRMPLRAHLEVGQLLKAVLSEFSKKNIAYKRTSSMISKLDDWMKAEYPSEKELPNHLFNNLYNHEKSEDYQKPGKGDVEPFQIRCIEKVSKILKKHYPDCSPLRKIEHDVESIITSLRKVSGG